MATFLMFGKYSSQSLQDASAERTKEALQHMIRNGQRVGKVRFGFDLADDGVSLVANAAEQRTIALMREMRAAGLSLQQIADSLSARAIQTKEGNVQWRHTAVNRILHRAA